MTAVVNNPAGGKYLKGCPRGFNMPQELCASDRLTVALQIANGNFGRRGGSTGSLNNCLPSPRVDRLPVPPVPGQPAVPVTRWPDAVIEGRRRGYPEDIHVLYSVGGNCLNQGAQIAKSVAAFLKVDFAICHELFLMPTAR